MASSKTSPFQCRTVLKRDIFSEISAGHFADDPETPVTRRNVSGAAAWVKPLAWHFARREAAALKRLAGIAGTPELLRVDATGLYRSWIEGAPLHVAKPRGNEAYFRDAKRLLRDLHRRGVTHNDLAKPQNWLMTPDGRAALIDMQLATVFKRKGRLFRMLAREDLRHLLKQKKSFCKAALTPAEKRVLATKSLPARTWMKTGKPIYNLVTRGIFNWSDGEGTKDRLDSDGQAILARLRADPSVGDVALSLFPYPRKKGVGIYAFVETVPGADTAGIERRALGADGAKPDLVQCVEALPRDAAGRVREDLLRLVAINQIDQIEAQAKGDASLLSLLQAIAADRRNLTDRRLRA